MRRADHAGFTRNARVGLNYGASQDAVPVLTSALFELETREAIADKDLRNSAQARSLIAEWVSHYNEERLNASLAYLPPAEYHPGLRIDEGRQ